MNEDRSSWAWWWRRYRRWRVMRDIRAIIPRDFCIISSNCLGSLIYKGLNIPYNTPTAGLFLHAPCFVRFASNLRAYLEMEPVFKSASQYLDPATVNYPIAWLDDVEVHFMHYHDKHEAMEKWRRRRERVNYDRLCLLFTDRDQCTPALRHDFAGLQAWKKTCFTAKEGGENICVRISAYSNEPFVGDLFTHYENFHGSFSFAKWLNK